MRGNTMKAGLPRLETEQHWKSLWKKEASHNTNAKWLKDLTTDHSNLPEQEPVTVTEADIRL